VDGNLVLFSEGESNQILSETKTLVKSKRRTWSPRIKLNISVLGCLISCEGRIDLIRLWTEIIAYAIPVVGGSGVRDEGGVAKILCSGTNQRRIFVPLYFR